MCILLYAECYTEFSRIYCMMFPCIPSMISYSVKYPQNVIMLQHLLHSTIQINCIIVIVTLDCQFYYVIWNVYFIVC